VKKRPQSVSSKKKPSDKNKPPSASDRFQNTLSIKTERKDNLTNLQLAKLASAMKVSLPKKPRKEDYINALKPIQAKTYEYLTSRPDFFDQD